MKKLRYPTCATLMLAALLLAACGGGGGSDPVTSPPTTAAPPTTAPPVIPSLPEKSPPITTAAAKNPLTKARCTPPPSPVFWWAKPWASPLVPPSILPQHLWDEAVEAAWRAGIVVLDCRENTETGFVMPAYYNRTDPEAPAKCYGGFPDGAFAFDADYIGAPASYRTVAEEYTEGAPAYRYFGIGGLSWAVPYAAGVLALGWQVNPDLDGDQMVALLFQTAARGKNGCQIVDPIAFIAAVEETVKYDD